MPEKLKRLTQEEYIHALNVTTDCIVLQQNLLPFMGTNFYNAAIVRNARFLSQSLKHICNNAGQDLFNVQPDEMENIVEMKAEFLLDLAKTTPEDWQIAAYILRWINEPNTYFNRAIRQLCLEYDAQKK